MNPKIPASLPVWHPAFWLSTWFGAGLLPKIPGTWGSAAALPFAWAIAWYGGHWTLLPASFAAFGVGIWAAGVYSRRSGIKDAGPIVIDEVAGQWLTLAPFAFDPLNWFAGFILFRAADIVKPWPASWADREVKGGFGVMLDDMFAGVYAGAALFAFVWLREWLTI